MRRFSIAALARGALKSFRLSVAGVARRRTICPILIHLAVCRSWPADDFRAPGLSMRKFGRVRPLHGQSANAKPFYLGGSRTDGSRGWLADVARQLSSGHIVIPLVKRNSRQTILM